MPLLLVFRTNICKGSCLLLWGFRYDRFGFKACLIAIGVAVTVITSCLPGFPYIGEDTIGAKVGYGTVMVLLYAIFPGVYAVLAAGVNDAFGPVHYNSNFGLLFTQAVVSSLTIVMMTKVPVFQDNLGYTGMFLMAGGFGVISIVTTCFLPRQLRCKNVKTVSF